MRIKDFIAQVADFYNLVPREQIQIFAWYLHTHRAMEAFANSDIRACFREVDAAVPDVTVYLPRMVKAGSLLTSRNRYKLEGALRRELDAKYGIHQTVVAVTKLLGDLPALVPDLAERAFLAEAISCYSVKAFRASIVMTWNLAFDHLLNWIVVSPARQATFNAGIKKRYPKSAVVIGKRDDFEELKEFEIIEVCKSSSLLTGNVTAILFEKLKRRNIAAHPSSVVVTQSQADDAITDLVNNVVLALR